MKKGGAVVFLLFIILAAVELYGGVPQSGTHTMADLFRSEQGDGLLLSMNGGYEYGLLKSRETDVLSHSTTATLLVDYTYGPLRIFTSLKVYPWVEGSRSGSYSPDGGMGDTLLYAGYRLYSEGIWRLEAGPFILLPSGSEGELRGEEGVRGGAVFRIRFVTPVVVSASLSFLGREERHDGEEKYSQEILLSLFLGYPVHQDLKLRLGGTLGSDTGGFFKKRHTSFLLQPGAVWNVIPELDLGIYGTLGVGEAPYTPSYGALFTISFSHGS